MLNKYFDLFCNIINVELLLISNGFNVRSFVTTPSGVYYSSNTGKNVTNATYSVGTTYAYFPTGCYTILNTTKSLFE